MSPPTPAVAAAGTTAGAVGPAPAPAVGPVALPDGAGAVVLAAGAVLGDPVRTATALAPWVVVAAYAALLRRRGTDWGRLRATLGWDRPDPRSVGVAAGLLVVLPALGILTERAVMAVAAADPGVAPAYYADWGPTPRTFLVVTARTAVLAVGEETLFRGVLGRRAMGAYGFGPGNVVQAGAYAVAGVPLLLLSPALWSVLVVRFFAGLWLGWLSDRAESVLPGAVLSGVATAAGALSVASA